MKIRKLETFGNEFVCFVRVTTDTGDTAWGQTSTYNADITATIFHRQVAPWALAENALDIDNLVRRSARAGESTSIRAGWNCQRIRSVRFRPLTP